MRKPLLPGSVIGILGGGQLGRMLAMAAAKLGFEAHIYAPEPGSPAFAVTPRQTCASYGDSDALQSFARAVDVVTYEFENIPAASIALIEAGTSVYPPRRALEAAQNRLAERNLLQSLSLNVAPFRPVMRPAELAAAYDALQIAPGRKAFLKRLSLGYDGKGQVTIDAQSGAGDAANWLDGQPAILEAEVPFAFEMSVIGVRGLDGAMAFYDCARNVHQGGILRECTVPGGISASQQREAEAIASRIMTALDYAGVMGVELFALPDGALIVNEIAPRVHNSGHWTMDGCTVSQFENHIRAIAGWPLGSTARHADARMVNLIGEDVNQWPALMAEGVIRSLHLYGKSEVKPGRKMGHYCDLMPWK
jgi:5-(carboxyamino)imidazole ribonucleotide synthase